MKLVNKLALILSLCASFSESSAFFGVEAVHILSDSTQPTQLAAMAKQLAETTKQLDEARNLVRKTNTLVQIAGDPKSVINSMSDLSSAARQLDQIFGTPTTYEFRKLVNASDSLDRANEYFEREVGNSFLSGKKQVPRQASLYRVYALSESSYDSFTQLVEADRAVQKNEVKRQEGFIMDLMNAKTQAEVDKINASIAASKAAQDASSHQVMKQKMEIDLQKLAMDTEREKIQTACDEEEAAELRRASERVKKREEAYKKQFNERARDLREVPGRITVI
ncbi:hypothetical protein AYO37_00105 [Opitutia bacterium SCGC AG-212-L18]|nr:hypothetical protein AYO37_00105 [Opitutae bacterium SCGC AG-212-L18]